MLFVACARGPLVRRSTDPGYELYLTQSQLHMAHGEKPAATTLLANPTLHLAREHERWSCTIAVLVVCGTDSKRAKSWCLATEPRHICRSVSSAGSGTRRIQAVSNHNSLERKVGEFQVESVVHAEISQTMPRRAQEEHRMILKAVAGC